MDTPIDARAILPPVGALDAARCALVEALREEGAALAIAYQAAKTGGASSPKATSTLRFAQSAHARSCLASRALCVLKERAGRV